MKLLSYDVISYGAINYKLYKAMGKYTEIRQKINSGIKRTKERTKERAKIL